MLDIENGKQLILNSAQIYGYRVRKLQHLCDLLYSMVEQPSTLQTFTGKKLEHGCQNLRVKSQKIMPTFAIFSTPWSRKTQRCKDLRVKSQNLTYARYWKWKIAHPQFCTNLRVQSQKNTTFARSFVPHCRATLDAANFYG